MKSFFKKLAFVMAMAMVVSLAAPAAAHADGAIVIGDGEVSPRVPVDAVITLTEGEEKDLCFLGAPSNWRELEWAWTSDKEEVATVDVIDGIVTAVAEGIATITLTMEGYDPVSVKVVVEAEKEEAAFDLVQVSDSKIEVQFPEATTFTANDVQFLITYANPYDEEGAPIQFSWKLKSKTLSEDKTKIVLESDGTFRDGDTFKVIVGGIDNVDPITVKVGTPDSVKLIAKDNKYVAAPLLDVYTTDKLSFSFRLMYGDIDVTDSYLPYTTNVVYTAKAINPEKQTLIIDTPSANGLECEVQFFDAEINADIDVAWSYKLDTANATEQTIKSATLPIASDAYTKWDITGVYGWAILPEDYDATKPVDWKYGEIEITADQTEGTKAYSIALLIKDNRGKTYVTHQKAVENGKNVWIDGTTANPFKDNFVLKFYPLNTTDFLLTQNGQLKVYKECNTGYYVGCVDIAAGGKERYIWAADIKVIAGKQLNSVSLNDNSLSVLTATELSGSEDTAKKTEIKAMTQYTNVALPLNTTDFTYDFVCEDAVKDAFSVEMGTGDNANKVYLVVDGTKLVGDNKTYVDVAVKVTEKETRIVKETQRIRVTVADPAMENGHIKYDTDTRFMHATVTKVSPKVATVNVKESMVDASGVATTTIKLQKTYNGTAVANWDASAMSLVTSKDDIDKVYTQEGTTYVVVRKPNGDILGSDKVALTADGVVVKLTSLDADGNVVVDAEGNYTIEVVTVRYRFKGATAADGYTTIRSDYTTGKVAFAVNDDFAKITKDGLKDGGKFTTAPTSENDQAALKQIVVEALKFKKGGNAWTFAATDIERVDAVVLGNYVIIKNVVFNAPAANGHQYVQELYGLNYSVTKR